MKMSRVEAHAESDCHKIRGAKRTLRRLLESRRGKENAISSKALADRVGLKATTVRDLIPELRREYGIPIASTSTGYYRISTDAEFRDVMDRIENTIQTKRERQKELAQAYYNEN